MNYKLFTIGYEKRTIGEYIELLTGNDVSTVIDVRENPWSHKPDFRKENLTRHLQNAGIEYIHVPEAGNPKKVRGKGLNAYKEYLEETNSGIDELKSILTKAVSENKLACLTCFERDFRNCHRSVLAETLKEIIPSLEVNDI